MSDYTDIEFEIADPVAIIRLNRPDKLNAFTHHTLAEIRSAVDTAAADTRAVGIIITGNGRGFSSGSSGFGQLTDSRRRQTQSRRRAASS